MIDSQHHVSINGVKYRLYESGGEGHYISSYEPQRPPNSVVVQGTGRQDLFQTRPDVLLWSITDWSGGEGQIRFDPSSPNRHAVLHNVDPFSRPGQVHPGPVFLTTNDSVGATWDDDNVQLVIFGKTAKMWAVDVTSVTKNYYIWNEGTERWSAAATIPTATGPSCLDGVDTDDEYLYYYDKGAGNLYKFDGTTATKMNSSALATTTGVVVRELGDYVYLIQPGVGSAWEIVKTATGSTAFSEIDNWAPALGGSTDDYIHRVTKGPDRLYVLLDYDGGDTAVREIAPSTAAGAGFGKEIAVWKGIVGNSMWWHNGMLFIACHELGAKSINKYRRVILYLQPGSTYGTLGYVRDPDEEQIAMTTFGRGDGSSLADSHFMTREAANIRMWTIASVSGGMAQLTSTATDGTVFSAPVMWDGGTFIATTTATTKRIWYTKHQPRWPQFVNTTSYFITPWHDMGLAEEKILSSITFNCNKLGVDWDVSVYYRLDGDTSDTLAGTYTTDTGTGTKFTISTDTSPVLYRQMRVKVVFSYTGGGTATGDTMPILNGVEVRSQLSSRTKVWKLRLDLLDDLSGVTQAHAGNKKIDNIQALDAGSVVEFLDGYVHRNPAQYDTYDVVVDSATVILDRPGEGYAEVTLRELA